MAYKGVAILIPVYSEKLKEYEVLSLKSTFHHLGHREDVSWLAPDGFDFRFLDKNFGRRGREEFPKKFFSSIPDYSRLLLSPEFYERFISRYTHMLIIQTDATVLSDELDYWVNEGYHYIGAPWPKGWSYPLEGVGPNNTALRCSALVGNGGFSLREIRPTLDLLREFPSAVGKWKSDGFPEDFYISLAASVSRFFKIPNIRVASQFSVELEPDFFLPFNGKLPFGVHAWNRYASSFWERVIRDQMKMQA